MAIFCRSGRDDAFRTPHPAVSGAILLATNGISVDTMTGVGALNKQFNIGQICTREQCHVGNANKVAFRWFPTVDERIDYTFQELEEQSNKFANALSSLGFSAGDILFTFLPKCPEQFFAFLGALKQEVIIAPLFANFGDEALYDRLSDAGAKGIVTKKSLLKKILRIRGKLPSLEHIIVIDGDGHQSGGIYSYNELMRHCRDSFTILPTTSSTPSVLHYTSGSTGKPKGVLHLHGSVDRQSRTGREVLNLTAKDVFWCTADQGWVTGTSYGIIAPWSLGITQVHYGGSYDAAAWFRLLETNAVTVWYTSPTALRMLLREEEDLFGRFRLDNLRHIFSVGEPLNPEVIQWSRRVLAQDIYDTWFQTETGAITITNRPGIAVRTGSMGKPADGTEVAIIGDNGCLLPDGESGNLCLNSNSQYLFAAYLNNEAVYASKFKNGWYYTGDRAHKDADGYFWFEGRSDDIINTAGHLISPFEVESSLLEIAEVAESGVIGAPDDLLYEKLVAFVALRPTHVPTRELEMKIRLHLSNRLSTIATPQEIVFVDTVPKNKSGKIMRRLLKARYLGNDEGDTSTLEI